jgi:transcriptional regulator with XRE-family HTH domain
MYDETAQELVRALRGKRSQQALNRRLGYTSNAVYAWEAGHRQPRVSDFFRLAALSGVPVQAVLSGFAPRGDLHLAQRLDERAVAAWVENLTAGHPASNLARSLGCNRNTLGRWVKGATEPRLAEALHLVDVITHRLLDFVALFTDPSALPSLAAAYLALREQRRIAYDLPWSHAVLRVLELEDYARLDRHQDGFIAARIGISPEEEARYLKALADAKQIRKHRGKWVTARVLTVDTREDAAKNLELKRHWARVGVERLGAGALDGGGLFSYNLFAISESSLAELRAAHLEYYERLRSIVAGCKDPDRLFLANLQLVPLDR